MEKSGSSAGGPADPPGVGDALPKVIVLTRKTWLRDGRKQNLLGVGTIPICFIGAAEPVTKYEKTGWPEPDDEHTQIPPKCQGLRYGTRAHQRSCWMVKEDNDNIG